VSELGRRRGTEAEKRRAHHHGDESETSGRPSRTHSTVVHSIDEHRDGSSAKTLVKRRMKLSQSRLRKRSSEASRVSRKLTEIRVFAAMAEEAHSGKASTMYELAPT